MVAPKGKEPLSAAVSYVAEISKVEILFNLSIRYKLHFDKSQIIFI